MIDYDAELIALRDSVADTKLEDMPSLVEQMTRVAALAASHQREVQLPVDPASPYFAHLRLREAAPGTGGTSERVRDVLIGRRGFIERSAGVQIVDWRDAPVSQIYYRYDEGDDYDELLDARHLVGVVEARRNVSIHGGALRRIGCPQGVFVADGEGRWFEAEGQVTPTLEGGQGKAARPPRLLGPQARDRGRGKDRDGASGKATDKDRGRGRQLGIHGGSVPRADKHLPEIAALIDREQFDLITRPSSGLVLIQGGAGSGKTTVAPAPGGVSGVPGAGTVPAEPLSGGGADGGAGALRIGSAAGPRGDGRAGGDGARLGAGNAAARVAAHGRPVHRGTRRRRSRGSRSTRGSSAFSSGT